MASEKLAYRDCEVSKRMDGTYEVHGENLLDSGMSIRYRKNTLEEIHQAVDDAYKEAQANRGKLAAHGVEAVEAHNKVAELDELTRQYGKQTIEMAARAGAALASAKSMLKRGQWLPWLEKTCPHISDQTARNYIKVAKALKSDSKPLLNCGSLMEGYVVLGIVSLRPKTKKPKTEDANKDAKGSGEKEKETPPAETTKNDTAPSGSKLTAQAFTIAELVEMLTFNVDNLEDDDVREDAYKEMEGLLRLFRTDELVEAVLYNCNEMDVEDATANLKPLLQWYKDNSPESRRKKPRKAKKSEKNRTAEAAESDVSIPLNDQPEKVLTE